MVLLTAPRKTLGAHVPWEGVSPTPPLECCSPQFMLRVWALWVIPDPGFLVPLAPGRSAPSSCCPGHAPKRPENMKGCGRLGDTAPLRTGNVQWNYPSQVTTEQRPAGGMAKPTTGALWDCALPGGRVWKPSRESDTHPNRCPPSPLSGQLMTWGTHKPLWAPATAPTGAPGFFLRPRGCGVFSVRLQPQVSASGLA